MSRPRCLSSCNVLMCMCPGTGIFDWWLSHKFDWGDLNMNTDQNRILKIQFPCDYIALNKTHGVEQANARYCSCRKALLSFSPISLSLFQYDALLDWIPQSGWPFSLERTRLVGRHSFVSVDIGMFEEQSVNKTLKTCEVSDGPQPNPAQCQHFIAADTATPKVRSRRLFPAVWECLHCTFPVIN